MAAVIYVISNTAMMMMMILFLSTTPCEAWTKDVKVKYYSNVILRCHESETVIPSTSQLFWITPDATVIQNITRAADWSMNIQPVDNKISMLNLTNINNDMFGYYTCVMVKTDGSVELARWGLNVDGADFSDLEEEYRKNAVIGAIAAVIMVVLVGGACIIWHFRYSKRVRNNEACNSEDHIKQVSKAYQNRGYDTSSPVPQTEMVECTDDIANSSTSAPAATNASEEDYKL